MEPEEIIAALNAHPQIRSSVVVARQTSNEAILTALSGIGIRLRPDGLHLAHEFLSAKLPDYMIPAVLCPAERAAPALPAANTTGTRCPSPIPPTRCHCMRRPSPSRPLLGDDRNLRLLRTVGALVGSDNISTTDNFFFTQATLHAGCPAIGAHSPGSSGKSLTLRQLFQAPTVAALAKLLLNARVTQALVCTRLA